MVYKPTASETNVAKKDPHGLKYQPIPSEKPIIKTGMHILEAFELNPKGGNF